MGGEGGGWGVGGERSKVQSIHMAADIFSEFVQGPSFTFTAAESKLHITERPRYLEHNCHIIRTSMLCDMKTLTHREVVLTILR